MMTPPKRIALARRLLYRVFPPHFKIEMRGQNHRGPGGWCRLRFITPEGVLSGRLTRVKPCGEQCIRLNIPSKKVPAGRYQLDLLVFCCRKGTGVLMGSFEVELSRAEDGHLRINMQQIGGAPP